MAQVPSFTLLAHSCWCQSCFNNAADELSMGAGHVCGHSNGAGGWSCVYCGGPVVRITRWYAALYQSVRSWLGWCKWEFLMWRLGY
jgi:hypothetical protein